MTTEQRARTEEAIRIEREWFAEDIARNKPDIVVFDHRLTYDRMRVGDSFRAAFDAAYAPAGTAQEGRFLIFRRSAP